MKEGSIRTFLGARNAASDFPFSSSFSLSFFVAMERERRGVCVKGRGPSKRHGMRYHEERYGGSGGVFVLTVEVHLRDME
jgi:hypothetical protein